MPGEYAFTAILTCDTPLAYASVCEILTEFPCGEPSPLDICIKEPALVKFMQTSFPGSMEEGLPTSDAVLAIMEAFPPPFSHADILKGRHRHIEPQTYRKLLRTAEKARQDNRIEIILTLKSPDQLESAKDLKQFLPFYQKYMLHLVGDQDCVPDNLHTTRALLAGKRDIILPEHRTFEISLPIRDITNSIRLLELKEQLDLRMDLPAADSLCLIVDIVQPQTMHLLCFAFAEICHAFRGLSWALIAHELC